MNDALLEVRNLNVCYGQAQILNDISLSVGHNLIAVVGRNGMGKTTLCQAIIGLVSASSGEIRFGGKLLSGRKPFEIAGEGIGYVPQGRRIFPSLSVDEHLAMVKTKPDSRWTVEAIYTLFPRLAERRRSGGGQLSGGEQQMLAIGRALMLNPRFLILDEPSEGLAPVIIDLVVETLRKLESEGLGILIVEQRLAVAASLAKKILVMINGRIAVDMVSAELLADAEAQRRYLGVS